MTLAPEKKTKKAKKLSMKARYEALTRGLDWEPSYVEKDEMFPHLDYEGIKIHDWAAWALGNAGLVLIWVAGALTVATGADYLLKAMPFLKDRNR